jgi:uncharacterized membrane protein
MVIINSLDEYNFIQFSFFISFGLFISVNLVLFLNILAVMTWLDNLKKKFKF